MENCLKTQLKSSVPNTNCELLGIIRVLVDGTNNEMLNIGALSGTVEKPLHIKITNGTFYRSDGVSWGSERDMSIGQQQFKYVANSKCYIEFGKYDIAYINFDTSYMNGNISETQKNFSDFKYNTGLIYFRYEPIVGNVNELSNCIHLENIRVQQDDPDGLVGTISGDLVDFLQKQIDNGRELSLNLSVSGALRFFFGNQKLWGGIYNIPTKIVTESRSKMYAMDSRTSGGVNGCYVYGYTDEEIETNTASGGIWEGKTITKCD